MDHNNLLFESCCNKQVETLLSLLMKNLLTNFSDVKVKKPPQISPMWKWKKNPSYYETYKIHRS